MAGLSLLALLALAFSALSTSERATSRAYLDSVRARLAAESGIHAAAALLQQHARLGSLWRETSWSAADGSRPRLDGRDLPDAATLSGGDVYQVRIRDAQGLLHLNEGLEEGPTSPASRTLARLLDLLGAQPSVNVPRLGQQLLARRPPAGFRSLHELLPALDDDRAAFDRVRPFLALRAWRDPAVANPVPLSAAAAVESPVRYPRPGGHFRQDPDLSLDPPLNAVHGRDQLAPGWIELAARAPVNVNTAPREILVALLTDLQGFFLLERLRDPHARLEPSPCGSPGGAYGWTGRRYEYRGDGEEAAFLHRTVPYTGPGGRARHGIPAEAVADEILACREGRRSPRLKDLDYAKAPFGGPFTSWSSFHAFVDALVDGGLVADPRFGDGPEGRLASRAAGDVLKANFNPNLHLNELNPDRILFTHVDKTDLLTASTEFCFSPMGAFLLESEGWAVRDGTVLARASIATAVQVFDARRLGAQADFQAGDFGAPAADGNNGFGVEAGPEPDNGDAPAQNGAEGWLQLATVGAALPPGVSKPKGELRTTLADGSFYPGVATSPPGGPHLGSAIHAHFRFDHAAHHHASRNGLTWPRFWDGFRAAQGAWQAVFGRRLCLARNDPDPGEELPGPYGPVEGARVGEPGRHRLARSWNGEAPSDPPPAPSDLRVDGAYAERGSAFGWWIDENVSFNVNEGAAAFWMKPAFEPDCTSKRRTLFSAGRIHVERPEFMNPSPFGLFLVPPGFGRADAGPSYAAGLSALRPASLAFGYGFSPATGYGWEVAGPDPDAPAGAHAIALTPSLAPGGPLRAHEWIHVGVAWSMPLHRRTTADSARIYVNGRLASEGVPHRFAQPGEPPRRTPAWSVHSLQAVAPGQSKAGWIKNLVRLGGEPSVLVDAPGAPGPLPGNYSADATFDEFYLWLDRSPSKGGGVGGIRELWSRGRYLPPDDADPASARWTSAVLDLPRNVRTVPPPVSGSGPGLPPERAQAQAPEPLRILGLSWTEFGGLLDHSVTPARDLVPDGGSWADAGLVVDGTVHGPLRDPAFSRVDASGGEVRVTLKLKTGARTGSSPILLSSPVVDDVTIFFEPAGGLRFEGWVHGC